PARLARVGPKSGPPCLCEPPTIVGAISLACSRHSIAPLHPRAAIKSYRTSPTVLGFVLDVSGHEKFSEYSFRKAIKMTRGRNCGTPKSDAFMSFHPVW